VGAREDPSGRLAPQVLDGVACILPSLQLGRVRLQESAHERAVLVQRRAPERRVLLEGERQLRVDEEPERAETEGAKGTVEMGSAYRHALRYFAAGSSPPCWQRGHQYAVRAASPSGHERIAVPQRGQGRPARR
jgi:hypothetical protein